MEFHSAALWHSIAPALGAPPIICRSARSLRPLTDGATPAVLSWIRAGAKILSALEPSRSIWEWSQGPAGGAQAARRGGAGRNSRQAPAGASAAPWVAAPGTARVSEPANALGLWQERRPLAGPGLGRAPGGQPGVGKAGL